MQSFDAVEPKDLPKCTVSILPLLKGSRGMSLFVSSSVFCFFFLLLPVAFVPCSNYFPGALSLQPFMHPRPKDAVRFDSVKFLVLGMMNIHNMSITYNVEHSNSERMPKTLTISWHDSFCQPIETHLRSPHLGKLSLDRRAGPGRSTFPGGALKRENSMDFAPERLAGTTTASFRWLAGQHRGPGPCETPGGGGSPTNPTQPGTPGGPT